MRNKLFTASVDKMLFKQYPLGDDLEKQKVVAKIFNPYGDGHWYLLNSDPEDPDYIWAIVSMFGNVEIGSVSRSELLGARIRPFGLPLERDLYFTPQNAAEVYRGLLDGKFYEDGGEVKEMKQLWFVTDSRGSVKNISTSVQAAEVFLASALKYDGVINYVKVPLKDWESEKVNVGNIRGYASSFWKSYKKGGVTDDLEKELRKLQRDLNSPRLSSYMEGDNSAEEMARQAERAAKLARFDEVLRLLRESDAKFAKGGEVGKNRYKVYVYYGGEMKDKIVYADTIEEAKKLSMQGEHSEVIDTKTNEIIEFFAKGGEMGEYATWEMNVAEELSNIMNIDYSDAQGVMDANPFYMAQSWGKALSAKETAMLIYEKSKFAKGGEIAHPRINWSEYYEHGGSISDMPPTDENGERKIDDESIAQLTEYVTSLPQTKAMYFNEATGQYSPERKRLHAEIINSYKDDVVCITEGRPIAILMGGSPASGKSSFLRKYSPYLLQEEILRVDADDIRAKLPEYKGYNATQTHLETKDIVNTLISDRVIGIPCDFDLIYDGTMNSVRSYLPLIDILKKRGYLIFIVYMDNVPKDVIIDRILKRYQKTGRFVPLEVVEDFYQKGRVAFDQLKNKVDGYMVIDGNSFDYPIIEQGGMELPQERAYSMLGYPIPKETLPKEYAKGGSIDKFKIGDYVYHKKHNTIGKVIDVFDRGDVRTDADGVVYTGELEIYDEGNPKHKKAHIAPSTQRELDSSFAKGGEVDDDYIQGKKYVSEKYPVSYSYNPFQKIHFANIQIPLYNRGYQIGTFMIKGSAETKKKAYNNLQKEYDLYFKDDLTYIKNHRTNFNGVGDNTIMNIYGMPYDRYVITFGFKEDDGEYKTDKSRPIPAMDEDEAAEKLIDQFRSFEGIRPDIISIKKLSEGGMMAKGGVTGYEMLVKKVAANYEGKAVPSKYRSKYGKRYDADEAKKVGYAVATKVYGKPMARMAEGGETDSEITAEDRMNALKHTHKLPL